MVSNTEEIKRLHMSQVDSTSIILNRMEQVYCKSASRRVQVAFELILSNKTITEITEQVKLKMSKSDALAKKKKIEETLDNWYNRASELQDQYVNFIENEEHFIKDKEKRMEENKNQENGNGDKKEKPYFMDRVYEERLRVQDELDKYSKILRETVSKIEELNSKMDNNIIYVSSELVKQQFEAQLACVFED